MARVRQTGSIQIPFTKPTQLEELTVTGGNWQPGPKGDVDGVLNINLAFWVPDHTVPPAAVERS